MSLIEHALKKLQANRPGPPGIVRAEPRRPHASERRRKLELDGPKHHLDQDSLVRAGLLAPPTQAEPTASEFRRVKRPLIKNAFTEGLRPDVHGNVIMITSPLPGAGKTFCSMNLAVSMSLERDFNVILVDGDVAKPHITRECGLEHAPGLIDYLLDESGRDVGELLVPTDLNDIRLLPAGGYHPQATELLASDRMSRLVDELSTRYADHIVLLDSPPLLVTSEAQVLVQQVGQVTLVVEAGRTTEQQLTRAVELLEAGKSVNILLNKTPDWSWARGIDYIGEYGYGSAYVTGAGRD